MIVKKILEHTLKIQVFYALPQTLAAQKYARKVENLLVT